MATWQKFEKFVEDLKNGVHAGVGSGDVLEIALVAAANAPSLSAHSVLADLTQISYTNFAARTVTVTSFTRTGGTMNLVLVDKTISVSGGAGAAFRYAVLFNQTETGDPLMAMFDYGSDLTLQDGESLLLDFAANSLTIT